LAYDCSLFLGGAFIGAVILALLFKFGWLDVLLSQGPVYSPLDSEQGLELRPAGEQSTEHLRRAIGDLQAVSPPSPS
jgi:hypothetical protein